ncbi:MAG: putative drug exporter of the superfamily [Actinomycetota bacterium]|jgi:RND superfamily putative drug exporter|nr:putative drug exporter of the superfamily [Actinomycetota bacterium]
MLTRLAHGIMRHRWLVIGVWVFLTLFGVFATSKVSDRWFTATAIPGQPAYEASQRALHKLGVGDRTPIVVVFKTSDDITKSRPVEQAMQRAAAAVPGAFTSSFFTTGSDIYVSKDRQTAFQMLYPPGADDVTVLSRPDRIRAAAATGLPDSIDVNVTGRLPLDDASRDGSGGGAGVLLEVLIGGVGALLILLFVFGTLPAVLAPLAIAIAAILNTFTLVWGLTYVTDVSVIVQFLIGLVGLGLAIDYALVVIFRFRDELREGEDVETALVETMTHAGRSVLVSGSTVAIGLLALVALPLPLIRSMGVGGMLIPAVSVLASLTLLPAMLAVLGERINKVRVMPRRFLDRGHAEDGAWGRWARFVLRRPAAVAAVGVVVVVALAGLGTQLNASETQLKNFPGTGTAIAGRQMLADAGISPGVMKPLNVLVENGGDAEAVAAKMRGVDGVIGAAAPAAWKVGDTSFVEAFPAIDGAAPGIQAIVDRSNAALRGTDGTLTGITAVGRDFLHALFGTFPYVIGLVLLLTLVLLTRAFRSVVLALKAVVLNLFSLGAAFGIVVFIFQEGHGSSLWNVGATGAITAYVPLMIFAFLFGLSMDYEVFMLARMREAYDETGSTDRAIELGLARTGKLVTSGALILMFAFLVLSTGPGFEIKSLAVGIAAGIIFDATVIRALLVPALMKLFGEANWWMPDWTRRALRLPVPVPALVDLQGVVPHQRDAPAIRPTAKT